MAITGYSHLALNVSDMEKSLEFYCGVLGFVRAFEIPHPETGAKWIEYLYGQRGQFLELFYGGTEYTEYADCNIGFSHICLETDDIQETARKIQEAGLELEFPVKKGCDENWQCWVRDPDRNRIEIMQFSEESPHIKFMKSLEK